MNLFQLLLKRSHYLSRYQLIKESSYSKSQFYKWLEAGVGGIAERKVRACKPVSQEVVKSAVDVIWKYPHFSGSKGQSYMIYHQLGYLSHHLYKSIKKIVKSLIFQEVSTRQLLPKRTDTYYKHEWAQFPDEIWAEDFTVLRVYGEKFYSALLMDVAMPYYLGGSASSRPDDRMVEIPIEQALVLTGGPGPKRFLLSDNGPQYVSTRHSDFLDKLAIIQKRIPSCKPEYNGSIECGIKEFKNVFYNIWAQREKNGVAIEKPLLQRVQMAVAETLEKMNEEIPRPCLKGVTPADVRKGIAGERIEINQKYLEKELEKKEVIKPWNRKDWKSVKEHLFFKGTISNLELMTKFCFFLKRPLRKLANLEWEVLGN